MCAEVRLPETAYGFLGEKTKKDSNCKFNFGRDFVTFFLRIKLF